MAATGFLNHYLNGPLQYVQRHITVNKMCSVRPFFLVNAKIGFAFIHFIAIKCVWVLCVINHYFFIKILFVCCCCFVCICVCFFVAFISANEIYFTDAN